MMIRVAFIAVSAVILSASSANAQGRPPQSVVLSRTVMKAMVANKPKSKTPLTARLGMVRRSSLEATTPVQAGSTSVREIGPSTKRK